MNDYMTDIKRMLYSLKNTFYYDFRSNVIMALNYVLHT